MRRKLIVLSALFTFLLLAGGGMYLLLSGPAFAAPVREEAGAGTAVRPRYELSLNLAYDLRLLEVRERMRVKNTTNEAWDRLVFSLPPAVDPDVFALDWLSVTRRDGVAYVSPVFRTSMLLLALPQALPRGEEITVEIKYRLQLKRLDRDDIHPGGNLGFNDRVLQCGDCFATLTPYEAGRGFREWTYAPIGDPYIYPVADYAGEIDTAANVEIAAAGLEGRRGSTYRFSLPGARSFAFTASKLYCRIEGSARGIPIACYFVRGNEHAGDVMLKTAVESIELYSRLYGSYPYKELVLAQNAYHSAMEYSAFVTISNVYIEEYTDKRPDLLLFVTTHEIAHQWWYGAVGNDQVAEPWLDESLAKYSEYLYFREYHPKLVAWWQSIINVKRPIDRYIDDAIYDFTASPQDYTRVIYGLAPAFIQELHRAMGEKAFFDFLKDYYNEGRGRIVTGADFFTVLARHTRADITPLLRKYFRFPPNIKPPAAAK